MEDAVFLPFERNHYYYGKLLSVADFNLEQRYHTNKRRMQNRFLFGNGVIGGLSVVMLDDKTISLESGAALDGTGREIVVENPVTLNFYEIDGYETIQEEQIPYAFLCIEYAQAEREAVHNIAGRSQESIQEFNQYREGWHVYLTSIEPKSIKRMNDAGIYLDQTLVLQAGDLRIYHRIPRYVSQNQEFDFLVEIEHMGQAGDVSFSYEVDLVLLKHAGKTKLKIHFDERLLDKKPRYQLAYRLAALNTEGSALAQINAESFQCSMDGHPLPICANGTSKTTVTADSVEKSISDYYYQTKMQEVFEAENLNALYLAKVFLVKSGSGSVISQLEAMPYQQYISCSSLNHALLRQMMQEMAFLKQAAYQTCLNWDKKEEKAGQTESSAFGIYEINLEGNRKKKRVYATEEIVHGLGAGPACLLLGIETKAGEILYGMDSILTSKLFVQKGTFLIHARFPPNYEMDLCRIHWAAFKTLAQAGMQTAERKLSVQKGVYEVPVRESIFIDVICQNMPDKRITFFVNEREGIVDQNGLYTAPDMEGIYEVLIESTAYAGIRASVYMVVRDEAADGHP